MLVVVDAGARVLAEIPPVREIVPRGTGAIAAVASIGTRCGDAKDELGGKEVVVANLDAGTRRARRWTRRATATRGRGRA